MTRTLKHLGIYIYFFRLKTLKIISIHQLNFFFFKLQKPFQQKPLIEFYLLSYIFNIYCLIPGISEDKEDEQ